MRILAGLLVLLAGCAPTMASATTSAPAVSPVQTTAVATQAVVPASPVLKDTSARVYILCFHDIASHDKNNMTTSPRHLNDYIRRFKKEGYTFLSLDQYASISEGKTPVPDKAFMLSFDDGYESFYKTVYPILKKQHVPAMMGIVGSWMDCGAGSGIKMSTWEQFREMEASGLVTIASHSYDLHRPVPINDLGEQSQAAGTRLYRNGRYENEREYTERLAYDFQKAQAQLTKHLGHTAKAYVWPFGVFTEKGIELGRQAGFTYFFQLSDGYNTPTQAHLENGDSLLRARRIMMYGNLPVSRIDPFILSIQRKTGMLFPSGRSICMTCMCRTMNLRH